MAKHSKNPENSSFPLSYARFTVSSKASCSKRIISPSSATRKDGSIPTVWKWLRSTCRQKLWIVVIFALCTSTSCRWRWTLSGSSSARFSSASRILSRISAAAAFVKVTTRRRSISTGFFSSVINARIRATNTAVLPDPAAAETRISQFLVSITFFCSSVHVTAIHTSVYHSDSHFALVISLPLKLIAPLPPTISLFMILIFPLPRPYLCS